MPKVTEQLVRSSLDQSKKKLGLKSQQLTSVDDFPTHTPDTLQHVDLSFNCLRKLGDSFFKVTGTLQFLDLSTNMLSSFEGVGTLTNLIVLRLSRNRLTRIAGLEDLASLQALDISMNSITRLEGLSHLSNLQLLYVYGNQIEALENLGGLAALRELRVEKNRLRDINHLAQFRPPLAVLEAHSNFIDGLDDTIVVLSQLPTLQQLSLYNNPIAEDITYQIRIVVLSSLKKFDGLVIKDYIREAVADAKEDYDMDQLYMRTKQAYGGLVARELSVKETALRMMRKQEKTIEEDFERYRSGLERELDALNQFIFMTRKKRLAGEDISRDTAKIEEWKTRLEKMQKEREESVRQRLLRMEHERAKGIDDRVSSLDLTEKLYALSQADAQHWRQVKDNLRQGKLEEKDEEYAQSSELSESQVVDPKEELQQEGLEAVMANMGGEVGERADQRLTHTEDEAARRLQREYKKKSSACSIQ